MNKDEVKQIALEVVGRVLEETAYVFTDEIENEAIPNRDDWIVDGVKLFYKEEDGDRSGAVHLWVPNGFASYAASNMLGLDEDDEKAVAKGMDALRELLNVILGNLLTEVYGDDPIFDITLPTALSNKNLIRDYDAEFGVWLEAEDNPVYFVFYPEE